MTALDDEVVNLARDLIRLDTTNAPTLGAHSPGAHSSGAHSSGAHSSGAQGNETLAARHLADYLGEAGVECELVARDPDRANLVARLPGTDPDAESLAFVGHIDVVPVDPRDWTHPAFEGVIDDAGFLYGRGAIDMKGELAARAVALKELARTGWRPRGDLWFLAVADEEDGMAEVGMRWLLDHRPDIRPHHSVNEGGGERLELADGRLLYSVGVGEKGTYPARVTALGEAGHGSTPTVGDNAVPHLGEVLARIGRGLPEPVPHPSVDAMLRVLVGDYDEAELADALARAGALHPELEHLLPAVAGITMAPTMVGGSSKRNVMPSRAWVELDCRIQPGMTEADVERAVRARLGDDLAYDLSWPEPLIAGGASPSEGPVIDAVRSFLAAEGVEADLLPSIGTGFTDSAYLRAVAGTAAYGFTPFFSTPLDVLIAGYHNADERIHVEDLHASVRFHLHLARAILGDGVPG